VGRRAGEFVQIPVQPAAQNLMKNTGTAAVGRDGTLRVDETIDYTGAFAATFRHTYRYSDAATQRRQLEEALNNYSAGATLDDYSITGMAEMADSIAYTRTYTAPSYAWIADDLLVLKAPLQPIGMQSLTTSAERGQPLRIGQTMRREGELVLAVPKGYRVRNLPDPVDVKTKVGTYSESFSVNSDGAVVCRNCFELAAPEIATDDYAAFRDLVRQTAQAQRRIIVLIEESPPEGD
jgi:hypothetical protein